MTRNKYFYIRQFVNQNDVICQYMNLDNLILILSTNKYFVRFKRGFSDKYEKTLPLKNLFPQIGLQTKLFLKKIFQGFQKNWHLTRYWAIFQHHAGHYVMLKAH